jgi:hypothetical protein
VYSLISGILLSCLKQKSKQRRSTHKYIKKQLKTFLKEFTTDSFFIELLLSVSLSKNKLCLGCTFNLLCNKESYLIRLINISGSRFFSSFGTLHCARISTKNEIFRSKNLNFLLLFTNLRSHCATSSFSIALLLIGA